MKLHNIFLEQTSSDLRAVPTSPSSVVQLDDPNYKGKRRGDNLEKPNPDLRAVPTSPSSVVQLDDPNYKGRRRGEFNDWPLDTHQTLMVVELVSAFFPPIGTAISVAAGLTNAALYAKEGDNYEAGLGLMFSVIPLIGPIVNKIPGLKTWSKEALITLGNKIKLNQNLTKVEKLIADELILHKDFIKTEVNKLIVKGKDKILRSPLDAGTKQIIINTAEKGGDLTKLGAKLGAKLGTKLINKGGKVVKILGPAVGGYVAYNKLYGIVQSDTPKSVAEKMGYDWNDIKTKFYSSNSSEDNLKLKNALLSGWKPDEIVPEKFKTKGYKEFENIFINKTVELPGYEGENLKKYNELVGD